MKFNDKVIKGIRNINRVSRIKLISYPDKSDFSKKQKVLRIVNKFRGIFQKAEGFSWHNAFLAQSLAYSYKYKGNKIKFKCDHDLVCNIDGEIIMDNKFNVKLIEKAILINNDKSLVKEIMK